MPRARKVAVSVGIGAQRQMRGLPEPHPAGPDQIAGLVIALSLDGASLHLSTT
jgi:hypothetical protein